MTVESPEYIRQRLIENLNEAAEIEHQLCLQYLYAALSIKTHLSEGGCDLVQLEIMRGWKRSILKVAREEMLHMALACNLLTAIGGAPYFQRPNFPQRSDYYPLNVEMTLTPFNLASIERFVQFESPSQGQVVSGLSVTDLYENIRKDFLLLDEKQHFVGMASEQIVEREITDPTEEFEDDVRTGYGVEPFAIETMQDVDRAINLIIEQGEGASEDSHLSHWHTFLAIKSQYEEQVLRARKIGFEFSPGRNTLQDPALPSEVKHHDASRAERTMSHPAAIGTAKIFNESYRLMMTMMLRFYQKIETQHADRFALQQIIFFPLMTMVIRPLAEVLTQLPADLDNDARLAGPSFDMPRSVNLPNDTQLAFSIIEQSIDSLGELAEGFKDLFGYAENFPSMVGRARFISENIQRLSLNFKEFLNERS